VLKSKTTPVSAPGGSRVSLAQANPDRIGLILEQNGAAAGEASMDATISGLSQGHAISGAARLVLSESDNGEAVKSQWFGFSTGATTFIVTECFR